MKSRKEFEDYQQKYAPRPDGDLGHYLNFESDLRSLNAANLNILVEVALDCRDLLSEIRDFLIFKRYKGTQ